MTSRPNIIIFMTDQQRVDTIAAHGASWMKTPHIDRLAREGVSFSNCFCTSPSCVPSRASFFTGMFPHTSGVYHNRSEWKPTWVQTLREAGYHTVNVGKMHTMPLDEPFGFDQRFVVENKDRPLRLAGDHGGMFDEWDKFLAAAGVSKPTRESYKSHPDHDRALGAYTWELDERYQSDAFVGHTAEWFVRRRKSAAPLFLQIGFPGPHSPFDPPKRCVEPYRDADFPMPHVTDEELANQPPPHDVFRREWMRGDHDGLKWKLRPPAADMRRMREHYYGNVTLIDEWIGKIMAALSDRGYLENAVVLFLSDHGESLGDHAHIQKWLMYDCVTRVPAVLWAPDKLPQGVTQSQLTQHMDLAATLLDLAGVAQPFPNEAMSLLDVIRSDAPGREYVFSEHAADNILTDVKLLTMVRSRTHKLVHYLDQPWGELYDLQSDPGEVRNRFDDPTLSVVKQELHNVMCNWYGRSAMSRWQPYQ
jgi:arylsulfatase